MSNTPRPPLGNPNLTIVEPPLNGTVGTSFSVMGTCEGIGSDSVITVTLIVTTSSTVYTFEQPATINVAEQTWEAYFDNVPAGAASIGVRCSEGPELSINVTVDSTSTTSVQINSPLDNQAFNSLVPPSPAAVRGGSPQPAPPVAAGKRGSSHSVEAYVTQAGYEVPASNPPAPAEDLPGLLGDTHDWSYNLQDLMPNPPAPGTYVLHVMVTYGTKVYYQAAGRFVYAPSS